MADPITASAQDVANDSVGVFAKASAKVIATFTTGQVHIIDGGWTA